MLNFQCHEPQIHILHEQIVKLMETFFLRFVKGDVVEDQFMLTHLLPRVHQPILTPSADLDSSTKLSKNIQNFPVEK